jgi:integrase/recombinase XerD
MEGSIMTVELLKRFKRDLALKGYSSKTQTTYYQTFVNFLNHTGMKPENITKEIIKDYLYHLILEKKRSNSLLQQTRSSISFFFNHTLGKPMIVDNIPVPKKIKKLPKFFSVDEVFKIINAAGNLKHKTMLMLTYSSGLRLNELTSLKVTDIHRSSMRLLVRQGKRNKDRYTILSSVCLNWLEEYWKAYKPHDLLFCGRKPNGPMSPRAIQHLFNSAKEKSLVTRPGSLHSLRHSFATHMLESGNGIFQLQKFLGHKDIRTTLIYAHVHEENITAYSPLDFYKDRFFNEQRNR